MISTGVAGVSVQGRPLRYAIASALPAARLRAAMARLRAVRAGRARSAGDAPAVVWVAGTVHGNEPSRGRRRPAAAARPRRALPRPVAAPRGRRRAPRPEPRRARDAHARQLQRLRPQPRLAGADPARVPGAPARSARDAAAGLRRPARAGRRRASSPRPTPTPLFHELPETALAAERDILGPAVRAAFQRKGYPSSSEGTLRPPLPRLRRQRHHAAVRSGRDDVRGRASRARTRGASASTSRPPTPWCGRSPATAPRCWRRGRARSRRHAAGRARRAAARAGPRVYGYALGAGAEPLVAQLMAEGVAVRRLAADTAVASLRPVWLPGARRAGDAARRHLPRERGPAAQALDRGAAGTEPVGRRPLDVRRQRLVAPAAHGPRRRHARLAAARRAGGGRAGARRGPAAGRTAAGAAGRPGARSRRSPPGAAQPNAGTSWARFVLARLGAQVDVVDDARPRRRRARGTRRLRGGRRRAGLALGPGAGGGLRLRRGRRDVRRMARAGHRRGGRGRPHAGDGRRRAGRRPGSPARRSPWAAAWCSTTTTRSSSAGTSSADYGAVLSGWTLGSPAGRPAILDERVGAGHAVLFAFDPVFRASSESAAGAAHERADRRHSRCSMIRSESQIASFSMTSSGTWRWPLSFSISGRSRLRHATRTSS